MANLDGIIPPLPSGGQMSTRQQYGPNGSNNPNYYETAFTQAIADQANAAATKAGYNGSPLYKAGGYAYGYGDPTTGQASMQFSNNLTPFVAGGKIIPSQYTMTAAQSVGPAQFMMNGSTATAGGPSTLQSSSPFTQTAEMPAQQQAGPSSNQPFLFGYNGSRGSTGGNFGSTQQGQSTPFYQSQPSSMTATNPNLGTFQPLTPQQQALIQAR